MTLVIPRRPIGMKKNGSFHINNLDEIYFEVFQACISFRGVVSQRSRMQSHCWSLNEHVWYSVEPTNARSQFGGRPNEDGVMQLHP